MGVGLSVLSTQATDDLPVTDPDKCQHKFCEKWGPGHYHCADCHSTIQDETLIASEDAIIDSIVDESVAEDGVYRGVSIQFLVDFATTCNCWDMTTRDVRRRFVMPATRASRCRFVELPEMQQSPQRYVGRAGTFVSHTWGAKFGDLVAALCDGGADRSRYVWVDIFAVRQWPSRKPDLDFSAVVRQCGSFVVVCSSLDEVVRVDVDITMDVRCQIAFLRVWCLVEIHSAVRIGAAIVMKGGSFDGLDEVGSPRFVTNQNMLRSLSVMVDIESADATVASDKERILNEIRASEGGVDAVNRAVRGALTGSLMAHPVVQCAVCGDDNALVEVLKSPPEYIVSAAGSGYVKLLEKLIESGADINHSQEFESEMFSPTDVACLGGHAECLSLLIKYGGTIDQAKALGLAAMFGHTAVLKVLLDLGYDVNADYDGFTALSISCIPGHMDCVKLLIERGADLDTVKDGESALGNAAAGNHVQIVQLLIDSGANLKTKENCNAVVLAAAAGNLECLDILIKSGIELEARHRDVTALMTAAQEGHLACVQRLVDARCNLDALNTKNWNALMFATAGDHASCVQCLIDAGCKLLDEQQTREVEKEKE